VKVKAGSSSHQLAVGKILRLKFLMGKKEAKATTVTANWNSLFKNIYLMNQYIITF